jgi:hypothetical protein
VKETNPQRRENTLRWNNLEPTVMQKGEELVQMKKMLLQSSKLKKNLAILWGKSAHSSGERSLP